MISKYKKPKFPYTFTTPPSKAVISRALKLAEKFPPMTRAERNAEWDRMPTLRKDQIRLANAAEDYEQKLLMNSIYETELHRKQRGENYDRRAVQEYRPGSGFRSTADLARKLLQAAEIVADYIDKADAAPLFFPAADIPTADTLAQVAEDRATNRAMHETMKAYDR